jgi:hypothetical protein
MLIITDYLLKYRASIISNFITSRYATTLNLLLEFSIDEHVLRYALPGHNKFRQSTWLKIVDPVLSGSVSIWSIQMTNQ